MGSNGHSLLPFSTQIPSSPRVFFNAHVFFNVVPPVLLRPNPQILHILPFLLLPSKTTIINTHSLLVQYLPTISPFGIDGNTCIQTQHSSAFVHSDSPLHSINQAGLCSRNISNSTPFSPFDINVKEETFFH